MDLSNFSNTESGRIILMILVLFASVLLGWLVKKGMTFLYKKSRARHKTDAGKFLLITSFMRLAILLIGVSYAISLEPNIKSWTTSLLASAGIATAIIGFAAKDVLANFVSGTVIIIFRPFTVTHWIKVGNIHEGSVEEIKMLYTVVRDKRNRRLVIPNSKILSSDVINSSYREEHVAEIVKFEISYDSDVKKAKEIIREIAEASPLSIDMRTKVQKQNNDPVVEVRFQEFATYSIVLAAFVWLDDPKDASTIRWSLNEEVKERFMQEGINIPYPKLIIQDDHDKENKQSKNLYES